MANWQIQWCGSVKLQPSASICKHLQAASPPTSLSLKGLMSVHLTTALKKGFKGFQRCWDEVLQDLRCEPPLRLLNLGTKQ